MTRAAILATAAALTVLTAGYGVGAAPPAAEPPDAGFAVDLQASGWMHRDDTRCDPAAGLRTEDGVLTVWSGSTGVLFWQIPRLGELPYPIKGTPSWLARCERPPASLWHELRDADSKGRIRLPDAALLPRLSWRWRWRETLADSSGGQRVSLGVTLLKRGSSQVRELLYVWSRDESPGTWKVTEKTLIPAILHMKSGRLVVRSGDIDDAWATQERDLHDDVARAFKGEAAGRVLRIFVKIDHDPRRRRG